MLLVPHDPGKGNPRLLAGFQIQRFRFRFWIKAQPKAKAIRHRLDSLKANQRSLRQLAHPRNSSLGSIQVAHVI
jgi:hypothetical protein